MKYSVLFIVACVCGTLSAENAPEYRARKAFEAESEVDQKQVHAIRECAVSKIQTCLYPLIAHLKKEGKENALLRRESAYSLGHLRAPEAREPLLALLPKETEAANKGAVIRALGQIGNKADIKTISPFLADQDASLRRTAARALYDIDDKAASAEVAGKIAGEKDDYTRVEMLNTALQHEGGKVEHALALSKILQSNDRAARLRAAEVLGQYKNREALGDLERALKTERDLQVRAAIYQAIQATTLAN
jgi:HEAT repeat protein